MCLRLLLLLLLFLRLVLENWKEVKKMETKGSDWLLFSKLGVKSDCLCFSKTK